MSRQINVDAILRAKIASFLTKEAISHKAIESAAYSVGTKKGDQTERLISIANRAARRRNRHQDAISALERANAHPDLISKAKKQQGRRERHVKATDSAIGNYIGKTMSAKQPFMKTKKANFVRALIGQEK